MSSRASRRGVASRQRPVARSSTFVAADADAYERQMGRWSRRLAPLFVRFAGVSSGEQVLDVGCGTGSLAVELAKQSAIGVVRAIDLSPAYVAHARSNGLDERVAYQSGDACALPFADVSIDHCLSMLVLQFIPEPLRALREMCRVTRPGGTVSAATWDSRGGLVAHRMILDTAALLGEKGRAWRAQACTRPMSRPGELAAAWEAAGLEDVTQEPLTMRMEFASFTDYWDPAEGTDGPIAQFVATLPESERVRLREAVRLAYLDGDDDGVRSYAATAWAVRGRRTGYPAPRHPGGSEYSP